MLFRSTISSESWFTGKSDCGIEEEDGADDKGFIIAIIGMKGFEGGLVSISGMRFFLPFICLKVKEYCENHYDHLSNCAFGMVFFLRLSI